MAVLDVIPREYWAQLKAELNALNPSELNPTTPKETPAERSARIRAQYDEAIKRKIAAMEAARRLSPEYKEAQRRAAERRKAKRDADPTPRKQGGRPRAPTDGLTPEQIEQRAKIRQRSKEYRDRCREAVRMAKERQQRNAIKAPQSLAETSAAQSPTNDN